MSIFFENPSIAIPAEGVQQAIYAVGAALVGMGGLIGVVMRWMMTRVDRSQEIMAKAIESFDESVASFKAYERSEETAHRAIIETQLEIREELAELRRLRERTSK